MIPKKVIISGQKWKVKLDPEKAGGEFDSGTRVLIVGTKKKSEVPEIFLHEIIEATFAMHNCQYENDEAQIFVLTHKELRQCIRDILYSLGDNLK